MGLPLLSLTTCKLSLLGSLRILLIPTALGSERERICFQELAVNERTKLTDTRGEYHPNEISKRMHLLICKLSIKWLDLCCLDLPLTLLLGVCAFVHTGLLCGGSHVHGDGVGGALLSAYFPPGQVFVRLSQLESSPACCSLCNKEDSVQPKINKKFKFKNI